VSKENHLDWSDWFEHKRSGLPKLISEYDTVEVMLATGEVFQGIAGKFDWDIKFNETRDITDYRVLIEE
jgi:hypothetical protein